jgi:hypothetical protein
MFSLLSEKLLPYALVAALVAGTFAGSAITRLYYGAQVLKLQNAALQARVDAEEEAEASRQTAAKAAWQYEEWKSRVEPKVVTVYRRVDRVIKENPAWAAQPLPDSVRDAARAAAKDVGATEPSTNVPVVQ